MVMTKDERQRLAERLARDVDEADWRANAVLLRHVFGRYAAPGALVKLAFPDHEIFFDPRDDKIGMRLLSGREWQSQFVSRAVAFLRACTKRPSGRVFIDVGANIGTSTIYALRTGYFSNVLALEPEAWNHSILIQNIALNALTEKVAVLNLAAGSAAGTLALQLDPKNFGRHRVLDMAEDGSADLAHPGGGSGTFRAVEVATVSAILEQRGLGIDDIGLVKIDVEGHEIEVLKGMRPLLDDGTPVMLEASGLLNTAAGLDTLVDVFGPAYSNILDLDQTDGQPVPIGAFRINKDQHDLLFA